MDTEAEIHQAFDDYRRGRMGAIESCMIEDERSTKVLSNDRKLIAVIGATGQQGGGVLHALQARGQFKVRALTRNPDKHRELAVLRRANVRLVSSHPDRHSA